MSHKPEYLTGNKAAIKAFLDKFDIFLFDCDGVLWSGETVFPNTAETLALLRKHNKRVVFVTNNSTKSRDDYRKKLTAMGIPATAEEVFGSSYSAAIYISRILKLQPPKNKVFILGEAGIETELRSEKIPFVGGTDPAFRRDIQPDDYVRLAQRDPTLLDPDVGVVLAGLDFHINYFKLCVAYQYLTGPNQALFLATNIDATLPSAGALFPGAGTISAPLINMLEGRKPVALGKPSQAMMDAIQGKFHFDRERACMVGDRLNTDTKFGIEGGLGGTLVVLTGVAKEEEVLNGEIRPSAYVDRLSDLLEAA